MADKERMADNKCGHPPYIVTDGPRAGLPIGLAPYPGTPGAAVFCSQTCGWVNVTNGEFDAIKEAHGGIA